MQIHQQNLDIKRSLFSCFGIHWIAFVILFMFPLKSHALCVDGDCFNGKGTYYFADGGVYKGDWTKGKMHGNGRFTFEKDWVDGIWNQGKLVKIVRRKPRPPKPPPKKKLSPYRCIQGDCIDGYGTFRYKDGQYVGSWHSGKRHGGGDYYWNDGDHYSGEWRQDAIKGRGFIKYKNGDKFSGFWKDNKRNGDGTLWKKDGSVIEGTWEDGKLLSSTVTVSKPGDQNEVTNRDLLNYVFYSNQSINKSIYRLKKRLSDLQATSPKKEKSQAAPAATRISNCIEAKEEVLRIREAVEGRQALEKEIPTGEELLVLHGDKDATEDQRPGYPLDRIFTYQDLVDAATHAETACQSVEGTATETAN